MSQGLRGNQPRALRDSDSDPLSLRVRGSGRLASLLVLKMFGCAFKNLKFETSCSKRFWLSEPFIFLCCKTVPTCFTKI